jgi:hypothetical protein
MTRQDGYAIRQAAYDLRRLRGKNLIDKPHLTRRYHVPPQAARKFPGRPARVAANACRQEPMEMLASSSEPWYQSAKGCEPMVTGAVLEIAPTATGVA